tara:strand:+ start:815 stop:1108 length:294 start_codon:yes stop_codon:yes gene_type:complete
MHDKTPEDRDVEPRIKIGKSPYNDNETVAFLYGFNSIEQCDYYTTEELEYIITCIEDTKKIINSKNNNDNQIEIDWKNTKKNVTKKEKNGMVEGRPR